jgi:hypothetical protein
VYSIVVDGVDQLVANLSQGSVFWRVKEARESEDGWRKGFGWSNLVNLSKGELAPKQEMDPGK